MKSPEIQPGTADAKTHPSASSHSVIPHAHPKFDTVVTSYRFDDGTTVEWEAFFDKTAPGADNAKYTMTIRKTIAGEVTYSMLTLGLQSTKHPLQITRVVSSGSVRYAIPPSDTALKPLPATGDTIPPAGKGHQPGPLDHDHIGFLAVTADTTLEVRAIGRDVVGPTFWKAEKNPGDGHQNNPPVDPPA